ncbi:hypothetical protein G5V58_16485 [Nocardioides anomalus]|uniref:Sensor domain-containing protein n=1 Tax=Nocardioides anomalus TaxID=2712223 RepID=A0A6G6WG20_9ACTN|nr:hypothetical protein [Nocardioides anomalus]QIG44156.1 hypothetical protein G5V58_16485 [Nocardioides anomalus]
MHRTFLLTLSAALLLSAPASAAPAREAPHPAPRPAPLVAGPLAGFDLDAGYGAAYRVTSRPGVARFALCGRTAWDPREGTRALVGVRATEPEWYRGRTLVRYRTAKAASAAVARARAAVTACPQEREADGSGVDHTVRDDVALGEDSVAWIDRYPQEAAGGAYDPGLTVFHVVRVGRAVLASYEYSESNATPRSRERAVDEATAADRPVVAAMADVN